MNLNKINNMKLPDKKEISEAIDDGIKRMKLVLNDVREFLKLIP